MIRTFGISVIIAVVIAVALSFLPTVDLSTDGDVAVFQREHPSSLSDETLVDFLSLQTPSFAYRRAEWKAPQSALLVEFSVAEKPGKRAIGEEWFRFARDVFQATNNVKTLICRLYSDQGDTLATLELDRRVLQVEADIEENVTEYLEHHFDFHIVD